MELKWHETKGMKKARHIFFLWENIAFRNFPQLSVICLFSISIHKILFRLNLSPTFPIFDYTITKVAASIVENMPAVSCTLFLNLNAIGLKH